MTLRASTTVDRIAAALVSALEAQPDLKRVSVTDGMPPVGVIGGTEWIAILDVDPWQQESRGMNVTTRPRVEEYTQNVMISVIRKTEDHRVANDRAWELYRAVEAAIRDTPTLPELTGDGQIVHIVVAGGSFLKRSNDTHREATIELRLDVKARI